MILPNPKLIKIEWNTGALPESFPDHLVVPFHTLCTLYDELRVIEEPGALRLACLRLVADVVAREVLSGTHATLNLTELQGWSSEPTVTYKLEETTSISVLTAFLKFIKDVTVRSPMISAQDNHATSNT